MLTNLKKMAKVLSVDAPVLEEGKTEYPRIALDVSCAFGNPKNPTKTKEDIMVANLSQVNDEEFLDRIKIEPLNGGHRQDEDWLVTAKWIVTNQSDSEWPPRNTSLSI